MTQLEDTIRELDFRMSCSARDGKSNVTMTRGCANKIMFFLRQLDNDKALDTSRLFMHLNNMQLAEAPTETMNATTYAYHDGVWNGLEMAFNAVKEWMGGQEDAKELQKEPPQKHGYWFFTEYDYFNCSECGEAVRNGCESTSEARETLEKGFPFKVCPYCGAIMDKKSPKKGLQ